MYDSEQNRNLTDYNMFGILKMASNVCRLVDEERHRRRECDRFRKDRTELMKKHMQGLNILPSPFAYSHTHAHIIYIYIYI